MLLVNWVAPSGVGFLNHLEVAIYGVSDDLDYALPSIKNTPFCDVDTGKIPVAVITENPEDCIVLPLTEGQNWILVSEYRQSHFDRPLSIWLKAWISDFLIAWVSKDLGEHQIRPKVINPNISQEKIDKYRYFGIKIDNGAPLIKGVDHEAFPSILLKPKGHSGEIVLDPGSAIEYAVRDRGQFLPPMCSIPFSPCSRPRRFDIKGEGMGVEGIRHRLVAHPEKQAM